MIAHHVASRTVPDESAARQGNQEYIVSMAAKANKGTSPKNLRYGEAASGHQESMCRKLALALP
jgi:hypothetical protein